MTPPLTPAERERIAQTIVRVCAKGHPTVTYYVRRDQPEPPCPWCELRKVEAKNGVARDA